MTRSGLKAADWSSAASPSRRCAPRSPPCAASAGAPGRSPRRPRRRARVGRGRWRSSTDDHCTAPGQAPSELWRIATPARRISAGTAGRCDPGACPPRAGAPALCVEVGELARGVGQRVGRRVEHPRVEHRAAARAPRGRAARGPAGGSRPAPRSARASSRPAGRAPRRDAVVVRIAGQRGHHVRVAVEQRQRGRAALDLGQRLMGDDDDAARAGGGQLGSQPARLLGREDAARADVAAHGVEHDRRGPLRPASKA